MIAAATMNRGRIVESAPAERIFADPQDEDTRLLLASVPRAAAA
jgi:ABC-type oligopeptide transport system ATPase subunit